MQGRSAVQCPLPPGWPPRWQYRSTIGRGSGTTTTAHPLATRLVCHPRHHPRPRPWACRRPGTCTLHIHIAAHQHSPAACGHAPGEAAPAGRVPAGRAGSRRGIRTRRRMQAGMDTCGLAHASEAAPGRQERRPARRRALAASPGSRRNLALRVPISPIGLSQFWAGVHKPYCRNSYWVS